VSEQTSSVDPPRGSRNDALLLALGETRAAAKQAADTAARIETAVSGLATRVGALEVDVAAMKATQSAQAQAAATEKSARVPLGPAGWVALGISLLTALYLVIDHTPSP
jgi:hypothetical protein